MSSRIVTVITQIMVMAVVISIVLLFMGIGILVLIHLCIVGRAFRRGLSGRRSDRRSHGNGMSPADVQKLPSFEYKLGIQGGAENSRVVGDSECAVCLDGFQRGEKCRMLPVCKHSFHAKCVDAWLYKSPLCPICRTSVEQHGGKLELDHGSYGATVSRVITCELNMLPADFAIGIPLQEAVSNYHNLEIANSISMPDSTNPALNSISISNSLTSPASPDDAVAISLSISDQYQNECQNQITGV